MSFICFPYNTCGFSFSANITVSGTILVYAPVSNLKLMNVPFDFRLRICSSLAATKSNVAMKISSELVPTLLVSENFCELMESTMILASLSICIISSRLLNCYVACSSVHCFFVDCDWVLSAFLPWVSFISVWIL